MKCDHSIVIPVWNQLSYTKKCLESLLQDRDRPPYEIVIVDNASSDGTRQFLKEFSQSLSDSKDQLQVLTNEVNRGVAPAWNQGIEASHGQIIGLLNNDVFLSKGWFRSLLWALDYHQLALISPFAAVGPLNYDLVSRAERFSAKNIRKLWHDFDFCAAVFPRKTYEKIGPFDENFLVGGYEDTDYAYRLKSEGMRYGVSGAAFIHHFGSQTLGSFKKSGDRHVPHNRDYFIKKWKFDPSANDVRLPTKLIRSWRRAKLRWDWM